MPVSDVLKNFRESGYSSKKDESEEMDHSSPRMIKLSDDEVKGLEPYQIKPGEEIVLEMTGKLEQDGHFHVMSVEYANGGGMEKDMAAEVAGQPPMMRNQVVPSPS